MTGRRPAVTAEQTLAALAVCAAIWAGVFAALTAGDEPEEAPACAATE